MESNDYYNLAEEYVLSENKKEFVDALPNTNDNLVLKLIYYQTFESDNKEVINKLMEQLDQNSRRRYYGSRSTTYQMFELRQLFLDNKGDQLSEALAKKLKDLLSLSFSDKPDKPEVQNGAQSQSQAKSSETSQTNSYPSTLTPDMITKQITKKDDYSKEYIRTHYAELITADNKALLDVIRSINVFSDTKSLTSCVNLIKKLEEEAKDREVPIRIDAIYSKLTEEQYKLLPTLYSKDLWYDSAYIEHYIEIISSHYDLSDELNVEEYLKYYKELTTFLDTLPEFFGFYKYTVYANQLQLLYKNQRYDKDFFFKFLDLYSMRSALQTRVETYQSADFSISSCCTGKQAFRGTHKRLNMVSITRMNESGIKTYVSRFIEYFLDHGSSINVFKPYFSAEDLGLIYEKYCFYANKSIEYKYLTKTTLEGMQAERILSFPDNCQKVFAYGEEINIPFVVKNIKDVTVTIFQVNMLNYFKENKTTTVGTDINLDGMISNTTFSYSYSYPTQQKHYEKVDTSSITDRGVYIVDITGLNMASRATIFYGTLHPLQQNIPQGHCFRVLDEKNRPLEKDSFYIICDNDKYTPNEKQQIIIPYLDKDMNSQSKTIYIGFKQSSCDFIVPYTLRHQSLNLSFDIKTYFNPQTLIKGNNHVQILFHPLLYLNSRSYPVSLKRLLNTTIILTLKNKENVSTIIPIQNVVFEDRKDYLYEFQCKDNYTFISALVTTNVKVNNKNVELSAQSVIYEQAKSTTPFSLLDSINGHIYKTFNSSLNRNEYNLVCCHDHGYVIPNTPLKVILDSLLCNSSLEFTMQTDDQGVLHLGTLDNIKSITIKSDKQAILSYTLDTYNSIHYDTIYGYDDDECVFSFPNMVPHVTSNSGLQHSYYSLYSYSDCVPYLKDFTSSIHCDKNGTISISRLPAGNYRFYFSTLHDSQSSFNIHIIHREEDVMSYDECVINSHEAYFNKRIYPLSVVVENENQHQVTYRILGADASTKVHAICNSMTSSYSDMKEFASTVIPGVNSFKFNVSKSYYNNNRHLSEELMYIEYRNKQKDIYCGNSLPHPGLLINPRKIQNTDTKQREAKDGDRFRNINDNVEACMAKEGCDMVSSAGMKQSFNAHDYLKHPSLILSNLPIDEEGRFVIEKDQFEAFSDTGYELNVFAYNNATSFYMEKTYCRDTKKKEEKSPVLLRKLKFDSAFDPQLHFNNKDIITCCYPEEQTELTDIKNIALLETLNDVYTYMQSENSNSTLEQFKFVLNWNQYEINQKLSYYKKYACHELDFFIYKKDRSFFDQVILPLLKCKIEKDFLDHYMVNDDLTEYTEIEKFTELNTVEKILLISRLVENNSDRIDRDSLVQWFKAQKEENVLSSATLSHLFKIALSLHNDDLKNELNKKKDEHDKDNGQDKIKEAITDTSSTDSMEDRMESPSNGVVRSNRVMGFGASCAPSAPTRLYAPMMCMAAPVPCCAPPPPSDNICCAPAPSRKYMTYRPMSCGAPNHKKMCGDRLPQLEMELMAMDDAMEEECDVDMAPHSQLETIKKTNYVEELEQVSEYRETYYYQSSDKYNHMDIKVTEFWYDYLLYMLSDGISAEKPFVSKNIVYCMGSFTERMFTLSVLDLVFEVQNKYEFVSNSSSLSILVHHPSILFFKQLYQSEVEIDKNLTVLQHYINKRDPTITIKNTSVPKYVEPDSFLINTPYTCEVIVINQSPINYDLSLFYQIPQGSYPLGKLPIMQDFVSMSVPPYSMRKYTYSFCFGDEGTYTHYPVHLRDNDSNTLIAFASTSSTMLQVHTSMATYDKKNISEVVKKGTNEELLEYIRTHPLHKIDTSLFRTKLYDAQLYSDIIKIYKSQQVYNKTVYSFSLYHNDMETVKMFLSKELAGTSLGDSFESPLYSCDIMQKGKLQIKEFKPLINSRKYKLGTHLSINNDGLKKHYEELLNYLRYKKSYSIEDYMLLAYYMFLQDRTSLGIHLYNKYVCKPKSEWSSEYPEPLTDLSASPNFCRIQFDYLSAYVNCFDEDCTVARLIAEKYKDYPIPYWNDLFASVATLIKRIDDASYSHYNNMSVEKDEEDSHNKDKVLNTEPILTLEEKDHKIYIQSKNVESVTVNYYKVNLEFMFSTSPFIHSVSRSFSSIMPNYKETIQITEENQMLELPAELEADSLYIDVVHNDLLHANIMYSKTKMAVDVYSASGYITVYNAETHKVLPKVYVKVYATTKNDSVKFFKDGYTDISGSFDYCRTSSTPISEIQKFALFISSNQHGSVIKEVAVPSSLKKRVSEY